MNQDSLSKFVGVPDLKNIISDIQVVQGTAKESGLTYYAIDLYFINGYTKRLFLRSDEKFAWVNAMDMLAAQKVIDSNF